MNFSLNGIDQEKMHVFNRCSVSYMCFGEFLNNGYIYVCIFLAVTFKLTILINICLNECLLFPI